MFTNQFPGRVSTFFARDMRALIDCGIEVDVFALYPENRSLWQNVPDILDERVFPRAKVHHINISTVLRLQKRMDRFGRFLHDTARISSSAALFGIRPFAKTAYALMKAWGWAQQYSDGVDHLLAYWGNYSATCAYMFHRLLPGNIPFSMFLHAGIDLYRDRVYLAQKMAYVDNIFVVCDFNRQFIKEHYPELFPLIEKKIHVHHLGLDLEEFEFQPEKKSTRKVVAAGHLVKAKGFDYLVRAIHQLKLRGIGIELLIIGDGKEKSALKNLASRLGIEKALSITGWQTPEAVRGMIRDATILVHPSPQLGDAVPTVIKEAMALGTPVIGTSIAGIPELLDHGKCGVLVPPANVIALAEAIQLLLADPSLRKRHAQSARSFAEEKFNLWRNGQRLAALLRNTIRSNSVIQQHDAGPV